ncbi:hypothetical protein B0H13DRAFT_1882297 [Mycena leptocephala]|nr:hypothetical protein B0H13DRAFT_1882297 [Mycena leptocephala]
MAQLSFLSVILLSAIRDLSLQHFHGVFLCGRLPPTFKHTMKVKSAILLHPTIFAAVLYHRTAAVKNFPALQVVDYNEKKLEEGRCDSECGARTNQEPLEKKCVRLSYTFRQGEENPAELQSHHRTSNWIRGVQPARVLVDANSRLLSFLSKCCTYMTGIFKLQCEARSTIVPNTRIRASKNYANPTTTTLKARRMAHEAAIPLQDFRGKTRQTEDPTSKAIESSTRPRCVVNCGLYPSGDCAPAGYSATRASAVPPDVAKLRREQGREDAHSSSPKHAQLGYRAQRERRRGARRPASLGPPRHWAEQGGRGTAHSSADMTPHAHIRLFSPPAALRDDEPRRAHELDEESIARSRPVHVPTPRTNGNEVERSARGGGCHKGRHCGRGSSARTRGGSPFVSRACGPRAGRGDEEEWWLRGLSGVPVARTGPILWISSTKGSVAGRGGEAQVVRDDETMGSPRRAGTKGNAGEKEDVEVECPPRRWAGWATGRINGKKDVPQRGCEERAREDGEGMGKQRGEDDGAETDETAGGLATGSLKTDQEGESALILHCSTPTRVRGEDDGGGDRE